MKNKNITLTLALIVLFTLNSCELFNPLLGDNKSEPILEEKITISIDSSLNAIQGQHQSVEVSFQNNLLENNQIGRFDFLFSYDASALSFQSADPGDFLTDCGWEYFTYNYAGVIIDSSYLATIRIRAIAETNNGAGNHPNCFNIKGISNQLVELNFLVTNDRTFTCSFVPINFYWADCDDNVLRDSSDSQFYTSRTSSCDTNSFIRKIDFINGGIDIVCADSIDTRCNYGDLNGNGHSNEIADIVLYSNYFIYGLQVFTVDLDCQIEASDVNADGLTLTVSDLVYFIRIFVGDALPYPHGEQTYVTGSYQHANTGVVSVSEDIRVAAAHIVVEGDITPILLADDMTMISNFDGTNTRILIYSLENNNFIGDMVNIGSNTIISLDMADYMGNQVVNEFIPSYYTLGQNYPNPFNPTTTIPFSLPVSATVSLTIYDSGGQVVSVYTGTFEAGHHQIEWDASSKSSGIYRYTLRANEFVASKTMLKVG